MGKAVREGGKGDARGLPPSAGVLPGARAAAGPKRPQSECAGRFRRREAYPCRLPRPGTGWGPCPGGSGLRERHLRRFTREPPRPGSPPVVEKRETGGRRTGGATGPLFNEASALAGADPRRPRPARSSFHNRDRSNSRAFLPGSGPIAPPRPSLSGLFSLVPAAARLHTFDADLHAVRRGSPSPRPRAAPLAVADQPHAVHERAAQADRGQEDPRPPGWLKPTVREAVPRHLIPRIG